VAARADNASPALPVNMEKQRLFEVVELWNQGKSKTTFVVWNDLAKANRVAAAVWDDDFSPCSFCGDARALLRVRYDHCKRD